MPYAYLAGPYSSPDAQIRAWRYKRHRRIHDALMTKGEILIAPVVLGHEYEHRDPSHRKSHAFWLRYGLTFLAGAARLYVLPLPGWETSAGLRLEVRLAADLGIPLVVWDDGSEFEELSPIDIYGTFDCQPRPANRL